MTSTLRYNQRFFLISCVFFILLTSACGHIDRNTFSSERVKTSLIIDNVNIVDVELEKVILNQQVIIKGGIIVEIRPAQTPFNDSAINFKDAKGGFLMPGLIDMHVHAYEKSAFELSLSHGVTHVRVMNGVEQHLDWRSEQSAGNWLASGMTVSSPIIRSGESQPLIWTANSDTEARKLVQKAKKEGYDLIKAYGSLSKESMLAIIDEANELSIPIAKHGPHPVKGMLWKDLKGFQSFEHVEDIYQGPLNYTFNNEKLQQVLEILAQKKTPITPTLNIFWQLTQMSKDKQHFIDGLPENYISPITRWEDKNNQVERWLHSSEDMSAHNQKTFAFLSTITKALSKNNIPILVGSDAGVLLSPHGIATHNELRLLREAGLSTFSVMRSATILPAKALGKATEIGQVKVGFKADLILTTNDPTKELSILENPSVVIKSGHWLAKEELVQLQEHAFEQQSLWSELAVLIKNY